jgi:LasA protease
MKLNRRLSFSCLTLFAVGIGACVSTPLVEISTQIPLDAPLEGQPTPLPTRGPHPPGELVDYISQTGDTLPVIAAHFNTSEEEIRTANPALPDAITTFPAGYPLKIPAYYLPLTGTPFHILPDSEVVNGPSAIDFNTRSEILRRPGYLDEMEAFSYKRQRKSWEVVDVIAQNYSIHPRLLLTLLEYQTQALSLPFPAGTERTYPLGYENPRYKGLFWQLVWAAERLSDGYYGWRTGRLGEFVLTDGIMVRPDPWQNAGTVAVQNVFAGLYGQAEFEEAVGPQGFYQKYLELWGSPFEYEINHIPGGLEQPELGLPFVPNHVWDFTGGPHPGWGQSLPWSALDFAPPSEEGGCVISDEWVAAPSDGLIVRSGEAALVLDLDGDSDERTGWTIFFFHMASNDLVGEGTKVAKGDLLGHPSCEGGRATGTHVHLARRYNGEWIPAGGSLPFILEGWVAASGGEEYEGTLSKGSKVVPASPDAKAENQILYQFPQ